MDALFGLLAGIVIGAVIGVAIIRKRKEDNTSALDRLSETLKNWKW